jgi:hypothetical protein
VEVSKGLVVDCVEILSDSILEAGGAGFLIMAESRRPTRVSEPATKKRLIKNFMNYSSHFSGKSPDNNLSLIQAKTANEVVVICKNVSLK